MESYWTTTVECYEMVPGWVWGWLGTFLSPVIVSFVKARYKSLRTTDARTQVYKSIISEMKTLTGWRLELKSPNDRTSASVHVLTDSRYVIEFNGGTLVGVWEKALVNKNLTNMLYPAHRTALVKKANEMRESINANNAKAALVHEDKQAEAEAAAFLANNG